ncbi:MAG: aromatic acid exporter family protein [Synechococcaceae cyanobacterium]|nr:aromatic acid exporter family protein [Synechococcaceae cyanobacterium]
MVAPALHPTLRAGTALKPRSLLQLQAPSGADLRASLRTGLAALLAGAVAIDSRQVQFIWYPLLAVVMCLDETETRLLAASRARLLGTIGAGLICFLVHTVASGWIGMTVALLLVVPMLRLLGWQSSKAVAVLLCAETFMVARYARLDWSYVFGRSLDTLVGVLATLVVGLLIWPIDRPAEIRRLDGRLRALIGTRLEAIQGWLKQPPAAAAGTPAPQPITASRLISQLRQLTSDELRSNPHGRMRRQHWRQRCLLWDRINHHSLQLQRLGLLLPAGALAAAETPWLEILPQLLQDNSGKAPAALPPRQSLVRLADSHGIPPLQLLAMEEELRGLVRSLHSLALAGRRDREGR